MEKPYRYQSDRQFFAQIAHPLEEEGCRELEELGASSTKETYRGIWFTADDSALYNIVYQTRLCSRLLAPLIRFDCHSDRYLYKTASAISWSDFLTEDQTFAITSTVSHSRIKHSKYAALKLKDAIVDQFREKTGNRPSVDRHHPDVQFHLHIENNKALISHDVGGRSLHRRGYRTDSVEAPMQETVAAAVIRLSDWNGSISMHDPMCGSGTLLAEALMSVCRIPAGFLIPSFGFERLPDFDETTWKDVKRAANKNIRPVPSSITISGSDVNAEAVQAARTNILKLPGGKSVKISQGDLFEIDSLTNLAIITNPPYGLRIGKRETIHTFYSELGDFLKHRCKGSTCYLYAGKRELLKHVGLKSSWKKPLVSGALDGRLAKFDLY